MWINHAFQLIGFVSSAWIMSRCTTTCVSIEVVVEAVSVERRSVDVKLEGVWHYSSTLLRKLFNQFTSD